MLCWGGRFYLCFQRKQNLGFSFKLVKIRFDCGRCEYFSYRREKKNQEKTTGSVIYMLIPRHWNSSETGLNLINLVGYRILMTYYYMPSFSCGMDKCLTIQSKQIYKVNRRFLSAQTQNKIALTDSCTLHILYLY